MRHFQDIFDNAPIGIFQANLDGDLTAANAKLSWMLGFGSPRLLLSGMKNITSEMFAEEQRSKEFMFTLMEAEKVSRFRSQLQRQDGSTFWALSYAELTKNGDGRPDGLNGFVIDISATVRAEKQLQNVNEELKRLSMMDGLTKIANRRFFDDRLNEEWKRMRREKGKISLILCDIDYFKKYNDTYGHQEGDSCLQSVAATIRKSMRRPSDLAARYGGEEFAVILPNTDLKGALFVAENIRSSVMALNIPHRASDVYKGVTLSLGVAEMEPVEDHLEKELILKADQALYLAKENGRNRSEGSII